MAIATELSINTAASALDMANAIFGSGVTVLSATYTGDALSKGIYSGATTTIPGISPTNSGVILSTGYVADFTNSDGTTNTNQVANRSTNTAGLDGDAQLNAAAGVATYDGAVLQATFTPDGDWLTMQFVFSSEEYPEYVNAGINDLFGVWVNGTLVPISITAGGEVSIDSVNGVSNANLYVSNTADQYNTEMDGFTHVLSFKAKVNPGATNTIKIAIADGADAIYDSNLLIMGDSIQTVALAMDDKVSLTANSNRTFDILGNDHSTTEAPLTITQINGQNITVGQTIVLFSGQSVRLNADGTVTVFSTGVLGDENFTYTVSNGTDTDIGYVTIHTASTVAKDGIVQGTSGNDIIDTSYLGDPDGDKIDNNDATGFAGTTGQDDYILAGAGNDVVSAGLGNDQIYAGTGNDTVYGGDGNDFAMLGAGDDVFGTNGADGGGNDTVYGEAGNDTIAGGAGADNLFGGTGNDMLDYSASAAAVSINLATNAASGGDAQGDVILGFEGVTGSAFNDTLTGSSGNDTIYGGAGNDTISGGTGADLLYGGNDADTFALSNGFGNDTIVGGEGGTDTDTIDLSALSGGVTANFSAAETGTSTSGSETLAFSEIERLVLTNQADVVTVAVTAIPFGVNVDAGGGNDTITTQAGADSIIGGTGDDSINSGAGADTVYGGAGNDSISATGSGNLLYGGADNDTIFAAGGTSTLFGGDGNDNLSFGFNGQGQLSGEAGNDSLSGYSGNDTIYGGIGNDTIRSGGGGNDLLYGDEGADLFNLFELLGTPGDSLANATVYGGESDDLIDTVSFGQHTRAVTVTFTGNEAATFTDAIDAGRFEGIESVVGSNYNDLITGTSANSISVDAGAGNDTILGGNTSSAVGDSILGGSGNDSILGQAGNDTLFGGTGNDTIDGGIDNDSMDGGDGRDVLIGGAGSDTLSGSADADTIYGGAGDVIYGGETTTVGGSDNDILVVEAGSTINYGGGNNESGTITIASGGTLTFSGIENIVFAGPVDGTAGNDVMDVGYTDLNGDQIDGTDGINDVIYGYGGNDSINAGAGQDTVYGGTGNDSLNGNAGHDSLLGEAGNDTIYGEAGRDTIYGDDGDDRLFGGSENDLIYGGNNNDTIDGGENTDTIYGGAGDDLIADTGTTFSDDTIYGGTGNDTVYGGAREDLISGDAGNDLLYGDEGADTILGGDGNDTLYGGSENDSMVGGADADMFYGGAGDIVVGGETTTTGTDNDILVVEAGSVITYGGGNNEAGTIALASGGTLTFSEIENIVFAGPVDGTTGNDVMNVGYTDLNGDQIDGTDGINDVIYGYAGNDSISAGLGDDTVYGGSGNDTINTGTGTDAVYGGLGNDLIVGGGSETGSSSDALFGDEGNDTIVGSVTGSTLAYGGTGDDSITGGDLQDQLIGDAGNDSIFGGAGNDVMSGDAGNDRLDGGIGNDTVSGGDGNDTLIGNGGNDVLSGGADADTFSFADGSGVDTVTGGETITTGTDADRLDMSAVTGNVTVTLASTEAGTATFGTSSIAFTEIEQVVTGSGSDTIFGGTGTGPMWVQTGAGSDRITTGSGNDSIDAGDGNDTLIGGAGNDTMSGGTGTDLFQFGNGWGNDIITGGESALDFDHLDLWTVTTGLTITLSGSEMGTATSGVNSVAFSEIERFSLGTASDVFYGGASNAAIYLEANSGNDTVTGGSAADSLYGGVGNDSLQGGGGNDSLYGDSGNDSLYGGDGNDGLYGGDGADQLYGGLGNDTITAGADADTIYGGAGDVIIGGETTTTGGTDNDVLVVEANSVITYGGGNNEAGTIALASGGTLSFSEIENIVFAGPVDGTAGNDVMNPGYTDLNGDQIDGTDGINDVIYGYAGNDSITAGAGNDTLFGGADNDDLFGGSGDDSLYGGSGNDNFQGGIGNDQIFGGLGDDGIAVFDGDGNTTVVGGEGGETLFTGDLINFSGPTAKNIVFSGDEAGTATGGGQTTVFSEIETIYTGEGADFIDASVTTSGENLSTAGGNDTVIGGSGDDSVWAGSGDDQVAGGAGNDVIFSEDGNDSITAGSGNDAVFAGTGDDTVFAGTGNDIVDGDGGNDIIYAEEGDDTIYAGADDDFVYGGVGNDSIFGEDGDDVIYAGSGTDVVDGGIGNDTVYVDADAVGGTIDGGENDGDLDVLDLTAWGFSRTNIIYDPLNAENGTVEFLDGSGKVTSTMTFSNIEKVVACFTPGTLVLTIDGEVPVEDLLEGDLVLTRDSGFQPIRWVGRRDLPAEALEVNPKFNPVQINAGALPDGMPLRDMMVSPQHRMLISDRTAELLFGEYEVLVAAVHLVGLPGITRAKPAGISYIHFVFDQHEIVLADGAWSESFQPGIHTLGSLDEEQRDEILSLFPEIADATSYPSARLALKSREAKVLMAQ